MSDFDWMTTHISAIKVFDDESGKRQVQQFGTVTGMPDEGELFTTMLDEFLMQAFSKKPSTGETAACKVFPFSEDGGGTEDRRLLEGALQAIQPKEFESACQTMARRYSLQDNARQGVLLFVQALVTAGKGKAKLPFFCLFKCDFEDAVRFEAPTPGLEPVEEVVFRKMKKCLLYPYFNGYDQDAGTVLIYQSSPSDYFQSFLCLDEPMCTADLMEAELAAALGERFEGRYERYFREETPKKREMFSETAYVDLNDLLPPDEIKLVSCKTAQETKDKYDKECRIRVKVDGICKFEASVDQINQAYFFARKGDEKFIIIRGTEFETSSHLSPIEFLKLEDLDTILDKAVN